MQVKRQCAGCGNGGDWALKIDAEKHKASDSTILEADATEETRKQPRRVSVLFYIADEEGRGLTLLDVQDGSSEGARLSSSGQHAVAGDWQLYVNSPGKPKPLTTTFSPRSRVGRIMDMTETGPACRNRHAVVHHTNKLHI